MTKQVLLQIHNQEDYDELMRILLDLQTIIIVRIDDVTEDEE